MQCEDNFKQNIITESNEPKLIREKICEKTNLKEKKLQNYK